MTDRRTTIFCGQRADEPEMTGLPTLDVLLEAARAPWSVWPARHPGRQAMGYTCSYVPLEIIHAAGLTPVRVRGDTEPLRRVDAHLQPFVCALCRSSLDQVLSGKLEFLVGMVFAQTCDAMQALTDLWRMNRGESHFAYAVMQPANLGTPAARAYLTAELSRFRERLGASIGHRITDDDLRASIALYDETRRMVRTLQGLRNRLEAQHFFAVLDAAQRMPREEYNPLLATLLSGMARLPSRAVGPQVFVVGAVVQEPRLFGLMDDLGARVGGDDLCSGSRHFDELVGEGDPILALTDFHLRRPPCPAKYHPGHDASRYLLERVQKIGARGVVFALQKYCEPHAFDYALMLPALERAGIPYLLLEMDHTPSLEAQRTRLQAFLEMLQT